MLSRQLMLLPNWIFSPTLIHILTSLLFPQIRVSTRNQSQCVYLTGISQSQADKWSKTAILVLEQLYCSLFFPKGRVRKKIN